MSYIFLFWNQVNQPEFNRTCSFNLPAPQASVVDWSLGLAARMTHTRSYFSISAAVKQSQEIVWASVPSVQSLLPEWVSLKSVNKAFRGLSVACHFVPLAKLAGDVQFIYPWPLGFLDRILISAPHMGCESVCFHSWWDWCWKPL